MYNYKFVNQFYKELRVRQGIWTWEGLSTDTVHKPLIFKFRRWKAASQAKGEAEGVF